jgi:protein-S-isoprenylcysteine O-methyltransferase Ste14
MATAALIGMVGFGVVCIGIRTWIHVRQTGRGPFRSGPAGNGIVAVLLFAGPYVAGAVLDLTGTLDRASTAAWLGPVGLVLTVGGVAATMWAQLAMGESWRVGVDAEERTELVTSGPYRQVRNPIYTAMFAFGLGQVLLVPNVLTAAGFAATVLVIELVVRRIEEPHLLAMHGDRVRTWMATTGRFLPRLGALR